MDVVFTGYFAYPGGALIEYSNILKFSLEVLLLFHKENLFPAHCQTGSPLPFSLLSTFGNWWSNYSAATCVGFYGFRVLWLNSFDQGKTVKLQNQIFCFACENVISFSTIFQNTVKYSVFRQHSITHIICRKWTWSEAKLQWHIEGSCYSQNIYVICSKNLRMRKVITRKRRTVSHWPSLENCLASQECWEHK